MRNETGAPAGVGACQGCGQALVWPSLSRSSVSSSSGPGVRAQVQRLALPYLVMPWTLRYMLGVARPAGGVITRACWIVEFEVQTKHPTVCADCRGAAQVVCPDCGASGRTRCLACDGSGEVPGIRKLSKKCPECRGGGDCKCYRCTRGQVDCRACGGSGTGPVRVERSKQRQARVRVEAGGEVEGDPRRWHPAMFDIEDFDRAAGHRESLAAVELLVDTSWVAADPSWPWPKDLAVQVGPNERIIGVRVQQFRARVLRAPLRTRWRQSELEFVGRPPQLVSPDLSPLRQRAKVAGVAAVMVALLGLGLTLHYLGRSPWFAKYGHGPELAFLALLAGGLAGLLVLGLSLPVVGRWRWLAPALGLGLVVASSLGLSCAAQPSLIVADQAIERGGLDRAQFELDALIAVNGESPEVALLRDRITHERGTRADDARLQKLGSTPTLEQAGAVLREAWFDPTRREPKLREQLARARAQLEAGWTAGSSRALLTVTAAVEGLAPELAAEARALAQLVKVRVDLGAGHLGLAVELLHEVPRLNAIVDKRALVEAELIAALDTAAREQQARGFDKQLELPERVAALERFIALERSYRGIAGEAIEGLDVEGTMIKGEQLADELAKHEAIELEQQERARARHAAKEAKEAKEAREAKAAARKPRSSWTSSSGSCCKRCRKGKPCGDTCIPESKTCNTSGGCAC